MAGPRMARNMTVTQLFFTMGIPDDRMTHQVLLQLFVVGDDAIVDDNKL